MIYVLLYSPSNFENKINQSMMSIIFDISFTLFEGQLKHDLRSSIS